MRAQGGVTWAEFNRETQLHGLALHRRRRFDHRHCGAHARRRPRLDDGKHGLAVDNLALAELVTGRRPRDHRASETGASRPVLGAPRRRRQLRRRHVVRIPAPPAGTDGARRSDRSSVRGRATSCASTASSRGRCPTSSRCSPGSSTLPTAPARSCGISPSHCGSLEEGDGDAPAQAVRLAGRWSDRADALLRSEPMLDAGFPEGAPTTGSRAS